jgi:hypothetical protein
VTFDNPANMKKDIAIENFAINMASLVVNLYVLITAVVRAGCATLGHHELIDDSLMDISFVKAISGPMRRMSQQEKSLVPLLK